MHSLYALKLAIVAKCYPLKIRTWFSFTGGMIGMSYFSNNKLHTGGSVTISGH